MPLSKEKLEELIARSTDLIIATNRKGNIIYYNDGASRSLGYSQEEVLDRYVVTLYPGIDEAKRVMAAMRDEGHGGKGVIETFQTTFLSKSGEGIPVAMSATLTYDEQGEPDGTIGFAKDLREILRKDQLATLGEVAVGLSHEINIVLSFHFSLLSSNDHLGVSQARSSDALSIGKTNIPIRKRARLLQEASVCSARLIEKLLNFYKRVDCLHSKKYALVTNVFEF